MKILLVEDDNRQLAWLKKSLNDPMAVFCKKSTTAGMFSSAVLLLDIARSGEAADPDSSVLTTSESPVRKVSIAAYAAQNAPSRSGKTSPAFPK